MADLVASDLTITPVSTSFRRSGGRIVENEVTIAFGDGAKTYPNAGIPLPTTIGAFGVALPVREIILITDRNSTTGTVYYADVPNMALHGWHYGYTPQIIIEEAVTLTSNAGQLAYKPAYIFQAGATISATVTPLKIQ